MIGVMRRLTAVFVLTMAALMPSIPSAQGASPAPSPSSPFVLALHYADGLVPVARWDGARWEHTWPEPTDDEQPSVALEDVPNAWLAGPIARTWWTWPSGKPTNVLRVARPSLGCAQPYTLETAERDDARVLAFNTSAPPVSGFTELTATSSAWIGLSARVRGVLAAKSLAHDARTRNVPVELLSVGHDAAVSATDNAVYFVRARQRLAALSDTGQPRDIMTAGWVTRRSGQVVALDTNVWRHWDDGLQHATPLAIVHIGDRAFWIVGHKYYQSGSAEIYEVSRDRVMRVLETGLGGC